MTTSGELFIPLCNRSRDPQYVRGHVPFDEARRIVGAELGWDAQELGVLGLKARHIYARWVKDFSGECDMVLMTQQVPARGAFAVTEVW